MSWSGLLYDWGGFNVFLFQLINRHTPDWLSGAARLGGFFGHYACGLVVLAALWFAKLKYAEEGLRSEVAQISALLRRFSLGFALAFVVTASIKFGLDLPRPLMALGANVYVIGEPERHFSLPSGHATFTALVLGLLWPVVSWRLRLALILYVLWVGWSRIAAGAHFPADVLGGWLVGAASISAASYLINRAMQRTDAISAEACCEKTQIVP